MQIAISQTIKNECKDYFYITLGLLLYTFGWTIFLLPYQIVTGGVTGIAAVIYYGTGIPIYLSYFLINAALLLAALKILGFKFMVKTIYAIIMLSLFLALAQDWMIGEDGKMVQILGEGQDFMSLIIGCLFTGLSLAIVFLHNGSTGGTDIIAAGAVVTHGTKVPAHEIWAGIPAKKVKACAPGQAEEFAKHYSGYIKDWYLKED